MTVNHSASDATGGTAIPATDKIVRFDRYEITVRLGASNEFLGIIQVGVRKDFLSPAQRIAADDTLNASDLYER